jgi:hypothetical protein
MNFSNVEAEGNVILWNKRTSPCAQIHLTDRLVSVQPISVDARDYLNIITARSLQGKNIRTENRP